MGHVRDLAHRQDLPGDVDHVRDHQQARARGDRAGVDADDLVIGPGIGRHADDAVDDAVAPGHEPELGEHVAVVLLGHHRFVARLPVVARHDGVDRLRGVARDAQLTRRAAGDRGKLVANRGLVGHLRGAQVVGPLVVDLAHPGDECLEHGRGLDRVVAALEVDVVGFQPVLRADGAPERLVVGEAVGGKIGEPGPQRVAEQQAEAHAGRRPEEVALVHESRSPAAPDSERTR